MDLIPIVFSVVIPIDFLVFFHHIYYSFTYIPNKQEKIYYYLTSIISLAPAVMYSFSLVNYLIDGENYYDSRFLDVFFKTWIVSNPLLLINLGKVIDIKLYKYMLLIICDILMYISGYISYRTSSRDVYIVSASFAALCFLIIMSHIIYYFYRLKHKTPEDILIPFYQHLLKFIIITWAAYPTAFLLFKEGQITLQEISLTYIALDFLTKTIFTSVIINYHRIMNHRKSLVNYQGRIEMTAEAHQVVPVNLIPVTSLYNDTSATTDTMMNDEPPL